MANDQPGNTNAQRIRLSKNPRSRVAEEARWRKTVEMYKLVYDLLKHLTTLSAGATIVILTLADKFVRGGALKLPLALALIIFAATTLFALFAMTVLSMQVRTAKFDDGSAGRFATGFTFAALGFAVGMGLVAYASFNQLSQ